MPKFLSWGDVQPLELVRGRVRLRKREEKLKNLRPEDLADYLEQTNIANTKKILRLIDKKLAIEVIENFNINYQVSLFHNFSSKSVIEWLNLINEDDAADILLTYSGKKRKEILELMDVKKRKNLEHLLAYAKTPIGDILINEFLAVKSSVIVREVIERIKKETADFYYLNNIYVVNENEQLIGVFNLHEMLMQKLDTEVYKFMNQNLIVLYLTTPKTIAIKRLLKYRLHTLPVIDKNKKILGIVSLDHLSDDLLKK
jgi:magnesium transporter